DDLVRWQALMRLTQHGHWIVGDCIGAAETARAAAQIAYRLGKPELIAESEGAVALFSAALGEPTTYEPVSETATLDLHAPWWHVGPGLSLASRLMWAGHFDDARTAAASAHDQLATAGREARAGFAQTVRSELELRAGRWDDADAAEAEATDILGDLIPTALPRLMLLATRGEEEAARRLGADILGWAAPITDRYSPLRVHWSLGLLDLSHGDVPAAASQFEAGLASLEEGGFHNPGYVPIVPEVIECRAATGRIDD